jgi:hypothetical protein
MINWLKKLLGVAELQTNLKELRDKQVNLEAERDELQEQVDIFRQQEEKDKKKYDSPDPWVEIRSADFNETRGTRIELDWNDAFIQQLKESGIRATNDEEYVQKWLAFLYQNLIEKLETKVIDIKDEERETKISDYI